MKYEKSCGAVIYRKNKEELEYLIILNKKGNVKGHWGFPKGHTENGEDEIATAKREIKEEVGMNLEIDTSFRMVSTYNPSCGIIKDAVYFVADAKDQAVAIQQSELGDYKWCSVSKAKELLTFDTDILIAANEYIIKK